MARGTAAETSDRIDALQGMILAGTPNTGCLAFARKEWGMANASNGIAKVPNGMLTRLQTSPIALPSEVRHYQHLRDFNPSRLPINTEWNAAKQRSAQ